MLLSKHYSRISAKKKNYTLPEFQHLHNALIEDPQMRGPFRDYLEENEQSLLQSKYKDYIPHLKSWLSDDNKLAQKFPTLDEELDDLEATGISYSVPEVFDKMKKLESDHRNTLKSYPHLKDNHDWIAPLQAIVASSLAKSNPNYVPLLRGSVNRAVNVMEYLVTGLRHTVENIIRYNPELRDSISDILDLLTNVRSSIESRVMSSLEDWETKDVKTIKNEISSTLIDVVKLCKDITKRVPRKIKFPTLIRDLNNTYSQMEEFIQTGVFKGLQSRYTSYEGIRGFTEYSSELD